MNKTFIYIRSSRNSPILLKSDASNNKYNPQAAWSGPGKNFRSIVIYSVKPVVVIVAGSWKGLS